MKVDLPEPDGPMIEMYSPGKTEIDTPRRACTGTEPVV